MSSSPKRWIVLLNKVPRGPLSVEEILALMAEGHLRNNDIAFEVPDKDADPNTKKPAEWKLLWQFPEFDRRLKEEKEKNKPGWSGTSTPNAAKPAAPSERRKNLSTDEAKVRTLEKLPPQMLDIAPEDLVVHSTADVAVPEADPDEDSSSAPHFQKHRKILFASTGLGLALIGAVSAWWGGKPGLRTEAPQHVRAPVAEPSPAMARREPSGSPGGSRRGHQPPTSFGAMPEARPPSRDPRPERFDPTPLPPPPDAAEPDRGEAPPPPPPPPDEDDGPGAFGAADDCTPAPANNQAGRRRGPDLRPPDQNSDREDTDPPGEPPPDSSEPPAGGNDND